MSVSFEIQEETRLYRIECDYDADAVAEGLRSLASVVEESGMLPRVLSSSLKAAGGGEVVLTATLVRRFDA